MIAGGKTYLFSKFIFNYLSVYMCFACCAGVLWKEKRKEGEYKRLIVESAGVWSVLSSFVYSMVTRFACLLHLGKAWTWHSIWDGRFGLYHGVMCCLITLL